LGDGDSSARDSKHIVGQIKADDRRARKGRGQQFRAVARTTAKVEDAGGVERRNLRDKITRCPRALMAIRLSLQEDAIEETHEVDVTPFIDVILVLLIIFMVAAPRPEKPLFVTVKSDLSLALGEAAVNCDNLAGALDATTGAEKEQRIFVRAANVFLMRAQVNW
jgi:biopolymer transport protein ExbD